MIKTEKIKETAKALSSDRILIEELKRQVLQELRSYKPTLKIKKLPNFHNLELKYQTEGAAGIDVCAALYDPNTGKNGSIIIPKNSVVAIPLGIEMEIPEGYEIQVRSRSSLSLKRITVGNSPGTIDSDYRNEVKAIMVNDWKDGCTIEHGDRVAQIVLAKVERAQIEYVDELSETNRKGGFGSTGKN